MNKCAVESLNYQQCSWDRLFPIQMKPYQSLMIVFRQLTTVFYRKPTASVMMQHSSSIKPGTFGAQGWLLSEIKRNFGGTHGSQTTARDMEIFYKFGNLVKRSIS